MEHDWRVLSERLKATRKFYAPRLEPEQLERAFREERAVIGDGGHRWGAIGFCALWQTNRAHWLELGTVWADKLFRGKGLRHRLMSAAIPLIPEGTSAFLFTDDEGIMRSACQLGFEPMTTEVFPRLLGWASDVGIVSRLPHSIHPIRHCGDYHEWGKPEDQDEEGQRRRWLFVRTGKVSHVIWNPRVGWYCEDVFGGFGFSDALPDVLHRFDSLELAREHLARHPDRALLEIYYPKDQRRRKLFPAPS